MDKDFDKWNRKKKAIDQSRSDAFCHPREVWWCSFGINVGSEENGHGENFHRPVVVIHKFNRDIFFGVALTGRKRHGKYYFYLGHLAGSESSAILSQVRVIDTKRLGNKICMLNPIAFEQLKNALQRTLFGTVPLTPIEGWGRSRS